MPALFPRPSRVHRFGAALALSICAHLPVLAQSTPASAPPVANSDLDAQLFYQLLLGEIELRDGDAGTAYQVMLDAARRTRDAQLFRRAVEIALQARAGDQALAAVMAWRLALPNSTEAHRFLIQLLVAMNRAAETIEPLRSLVRITPQPDRAALIPGLPGFFTRSSDRAQSARLIDEALKPFVDDASTRAPALVASARAWLAVPDPAKALAALRRAVAEDPTSEAAGLTAVAALDGSPDAEPLILAHLAAKPDSHNVRLGYIRALTTSQRYGDAVNQLQTMTRLAP